MLSIVNRASDVAADQRRFAALLPPVTCLLLAGAAAGLMSPYVWWAERLLPENFLPLVALVYVGLVLAVSVASGAVAFFVFSSAKQIANRAGFRRVALAGMWLGPALILAHLGPLAAVAGGAIAAVAVAKCVPDSYGSSFRTRVTSGFSAPGNNLFVALDSAPFPALRPEFGFIALTLHAGALALLLGHAFAAVLLITAGCFATAWKSGSATVYPRCGYNPGPIHAQNDREPAACACTCERRVSP